MSLAVSWTSTSSKDTASAVASSATGVLLLPVSLTLMVCSTHGDTLPEASIARQNTLVTPNGKVSGPSNSMLGSRSATSNTCGEPVATNTGAVLDPTTTDGGGAICGGWVSSTMMVCIRVEVLNPPPGAGPASRAVQVTGWLPSGRNEGSGALTCGVRLHASVAMIESRSVSRNARVDCPPGSWASTRKVANPGSTNCMTGSVVSSTLTDWLASVTTPVG